MNIRTLAALPLLGIAFLAAPAFAGPDCDGMAMTTPMWEVAKSFEEAGGAIRDMKVEDGCYEIKGEAAGKKYEIYYNPTTGAELERIED